MSNLKLYVDDVRPAPKGWDLAKSFHEAIYRLEKKMYREVSLDHDLGCFYGNKEMTGGDILKWLIARKLEGKHVPKIVRLHTANVVALNWMEEDVKRYWGELYMPLIRDTIILAGGDVLAADEAQELEDWLLSTSDHGC